MSQSNTGAVSALVGALGVSVLSGVMLIGPVGTAQATTPVAASGYAVDSSAAAPAQPDQPGESSASSPDPHTALLGRGNWGGHRYWGNGGWGGNWRGGWGNGWGNGQGNGWGNDGWHGNWGGGGWGH